MIKRKDLISIQLLLGRIQGGWCSLSSLWYDGKIFLAFNIPVLLIRQDNRVWFWGFLLRAVQVIVGFCRRGAMVLSGSPGFLG